ncbi:MAG: 30S ribosomal protein S13 [Candidatus Hydrogenedentes bacterium]|jgi:small subunit ribosomal protein S13|nr:30S ribosomal protein S13 [Candidatus Hydrogenedentota bacterium]
MARIVGVELPRDKRVEAGLQAIYGIGPTRAKELLTKAGVNPDTRVRDLNDEEVNKISGVIQSDYKVEGDLRRETNANIKRLMDIGSYRGMRHKRGLPVRGQRTNTNARTRKGPRRMAVVKKKS